MKAYFTIKVIYLIRFDYTGHYACSFILILTHMNIDLTDIRKQSFVRDKITELFLGKPYYLAWWNPLLLVNLNGGDGKMIGFSLYLWEKTFNQVTK